MAAGGTATYGVQVFAASGFSGTVSLTCTGAPAGAQCTPSQGSVNVSSGSSTTASFTVTTSSGAGAPVTPSSWANPPATWLGYLGLVAMGLIASVAGRRKLAPVLAAGLLVALLGCGGSGGSGGGGGGGGGGGTQAIAPGTYPLTLTASEGSVTQKTTVTLNVQ